MHPTLRRLLPGFTFFAILFVWIAFKVRLNFPTEFPALSLLCKWDCGWYESIARQGYLSPIPPIHQDSEHSNVAFFPAYPLLGRAFAWLLQIPLTWALPLVSMTCASLVSIALSRLLAAETRGSRWFRYAVLVAYPASFYLFVSYSEALYLSAMLGGTALMMSTQERAKRTALPLIIVAGIALGGTRLTGFVIPSFLLLAALLLRDSARLRASAFFLGAAGSAAAFFAFCAVKFGHWNLYFQQLAIGWYKEFSPLKALNILLNRPFPPTLDRELLLSDSRRLSWMVITTILGVSIYAGIRALRSAVVAYRERDRALFFRCFLVFAAFAHFFIVVCGDVGPWDYWGNGLRYPMPTVYLLAVAWRDEWTPRLIRAHLVTRLIAWAAALGVLGWLFSLEMEFLVRFIRNEWVS